MQRSQERLLALAVGAIAGAGAAALLAYLRRPSQPPKAAHPQDRDPPKRSQVPDEVKQEIYSRSIAFFGADGFGRVQRAQVVVVGLGGVGSHAANALVRSGVTRIRLVDFDQVSCSSLNRHALAGLADVGSSKVQVVRSRLLEIMPWCEVEVMAVMFNQASADACLAGRPDYVLDCIDDISTKALLIASCVKGGLRILTCMGAGGKADPTRIRIGSLKDCVRDPLAAKIRWKLKSHAVAPDAVTTIYSSEKPVCDLLPLTEEQRDNPQEFGAVDYLRLRVMPVLGTSPSIFGQAMASYALCDIAGCPYAPESCDAMSKNLRHKMLSALKKNEKARFNDTSSLDLDDEDLEFVVHAVWRGRCAITDRRIGGNTSLVLTRWDGAAPPSVWNLVLLAPHVADLLVGGAGVAEEARARVGRRLAWAQAAAAKA